MQVHRLDPVVQACLQKFFLRTLFFNESSFVNESSTCFSVTLLLSKIESIEVEPVPVDHLLPGVCGFIIHTSKGSIGYTADLRFHGRRKQESQKFVELCAESDLDHILCEGTRVKEPTSMTEYEVETDIKDIVNTTENLVVVTYSVRDLDRLMSFYLAAKDTGRKLVIDMKQAYLLKLFGESEKLSGIYPKIDDPVIKKF